MNEIAVLVLVPSYRGMLTTKLKIKRIDLGMTVLVPSYRGMLTTLRITFDIPKHYLKFSSPLIGEC